MKIKTSFLYFILIFLISNLIFSKDVNFTYLNKKIGAGVEFPENWDLYTNKKNSNEYFKKYFNDNKSPDESPLFMGMRKDQQLFVRLLFEKYEGSIEDYIKLLYLTNKNIISVNSIKKNDNSVIWIFTSTINNFTFKYYEAFTKHNGLVIRLSFWTLEMLFEENINKIKDIFKKFYLKDFSKLNQWINPFKEIETIFIDADYEFLQNDIEKNKQEDSLNKVKGIFYEVEGKNNKIFLMGSVHMGRPDFYPLPQTIENAFEQTKNIAVEVNVNDHEVENKAKSLLETALISDNKTLDMILPEKLYKDIEKLFLSLGLPMEKFNRFEPWFLNIIINTFQYIKAGYIDKYGVEKYFLNKNIKDKNIIELETFESQVEIFKNVDCTSQLAYTMLFYETSTIKIEELMDAWKKGDDKKLEEIIFSKSYSSIENFDNFYNDLFYKRNTNFVNQILNFLEKKENYFIIIGSGHLIGDKGIINILKEKGFKVNKY